MHFGPEDDAGVTAPSRRSDDTAHAMADEYDEWIAFYHRGDGDFPDFLRQRTPKASGLAQQLTAAVEAIEADHDPLCMSVLRGKACTCGVLGTGSAAGRTTAEFSSLRTQAHGYGVPAVDLVRAERERCARIADDEARIREEAGQKHVDGSVARGRCFAGARAAANVAKGIRSGEVVSDAAQPAKGDA